MSYYGDRGIAVVQPEQRMRWIFEPAPPETLFAAPGLALGEPGRRFDLILGMRFRKVEPAGLLERRGGGGAVEAYELYRVADPYAPVLDRLSARRGRSRPAMSVVTNKGAGLCPIRRQRAQAEARGAFARVGERTEAQRLFETGGLRWRFPRSSIPCEAAIVNTGGGVAAAIPIA